MCDLPSTLKQATQNLLSWYPGFICSPGKEANDGNFIQRGVVTVVIRLFDLKLSNSSQKAPDNQKENAKKIWQLIEDVNKAVHGQNFLQEGYGLPMRTQMRRTKREDGCYQTELYYTIGFTDTTCVPVPVTTPVRPLVTVSVAKI